MKHIRSVVAGTLALPLALSLGAWTVPGSSSSLPELSSGDSDTPPASNPADNLPDTFDLQSHRFGRGEWTEQSELGLVESQKLDVTTLEFDIVLSEDGVPVVWHDPSIQADKCDDTAPVTEDDPEFPYVGQLVNELSWDQLQTLNCNKPLAGYPDAEHPEVNRLLQLRDVFELTKDDSEVHYNIETKVEADNPGASATPEEFVDAILPVIAEYEVAERSMIQSFDWRTLPLVREQAPEIPLVMLWSDGTWQSGSAFTGKVDYDEVDGHILAAADQLGVEVLSPGYTAYGRGEDGGIDAEAARAFNEEAHERGYRVVPWTVNDGAEMHAQIEAGVDGLITDYPSRLKAILDERGIEF